MWLYGMITNLFLTITLTVVDGWDSLYSHHMSGGGSTTTCLSDGDCDVTGVGQSCLWLYEGCDNGQCMCDPSRNVRLSNGKCVQFKLGQERCRSHDVCKEGMSCQGGTCQCLSGSVMTPDKTHCLRKRQKLLGDDCDQSRDTCLQIAGYGYTSNEVDCSGAERKCRCKDGVKTDGFTCRNWKLNERGCSNIYHCEGGAICVDRQCVCPSGYISGAGGTKCVRRDAVRDLPVGSECDEINERLYCAQGLVCHRCSHKTIHRCVRYGSVLLKFRLRLFRPHPRDVIANKHLLLDNDDVVSINSISIKNAVFQLAAA